MNQFQDFCNSSYRRHFENKFNEFKNTENDDKARIISQKFAMKESFRESINTFPDHCPAIIWKYLHEAHISKLVGINIPKEQIDQVISADQSWKKSSGHAFEEFLKDICNSKLLPYNLELLLQRDISELRNEGRLIAEDQDLDWLDEQLASSTFDLYLCIKDELRFKIFGCVQAKTSIRDRVTRDREPSIQAMNSFYVSLAMVLDGEYLKNPKFQEMVNGGSSRYRENGWHAMYIFSKEPMIEINRIKTLDSDLNPFIDDCRNAANSWIQSRQWINPSWEL